jgi:glycine dehydrogenase subunit 2
MIFEKSSPGRRAFIPPQNGVEDSFKNMPESLTRKIALGLPEVSELEVVRHYVNLSHNNHAIDLGFYPLGSCTMKYNPKINETTVPLFSSLHPMQKDEESQGILEMVYLLLEGLSEITGMDWGTLQPFAGAQGEFTAMKIFRAYFDHKKQSKRKNILVPDSAHGTNPASAHLAGFNVVEIKSDSRGLISAESIKPHLNEELAGIMLTNPNTLGLFEEDIAQIATLVHKAGGLLYYDGANLNAILGKVRPGDMGFDVMHLNLHKTFSTPHGGGGPGAGPVMVKRHLEDFLPVPVVRKTESGFINDNSLPFTIGRVGCFHGNVGILIRAYTYLRSMGRDGMKKIAEMAVLNANYLKERLKPLLHLPFDRLCKHEFVLSARKLKEETGASALDIAKALLDFGIHPPTVYFPLIVPEALMIEPTETETKEVLDNFVKVIEEILDLAKNNAEELHELPRKQKVRRVDEVLAAKKPKVRWQSEKVID